ncbi:MAG: class I SAM-dependent methyltransferase [Chloroflexi bacterium]|nr:class I SAM-dependent methyltransferase [Chloroflexota bacterium]
MNVKARVQDQFGRYVGRYVDSPVHARGASLVRLVELLRPRSADCLLDIATAAGHTALTFAPHVRRVVATDLTTEALPKARALAESRGLVVPLLAAADAEGLPFPDDTFDLVTCRLGLHHFPHPRQAVAEMVRVCRPGGSVGLVDNVVPEDEGAGAFINQFEDYRDPSHFCEHPLSALRRFLEQGGAQVTHTEVEPKTMDFVAWAWRMGVSEEGQAHLRAMLDRAPPAARASLQPRLEEGALKFNLLEGLLVGVKRED